MVPDKFNMVDMGGIDLIMAQGDTIPGLYDRLVESITLCRYQCLYNWIFDGVQIPPTYVQMSVDSETGNVVINEGVEVDDEDVIHIYSLETEAHLIALIASENGVFVPPEGVDGFNQVTVNVPAVTPVLENLSVAENGVYTPSTGVDGFNQVTVNVSAVTPVLESLSVTQNGVYTPPTGVDGFNQVTVNAQGTSFVEDTYSQLLTNYFDTEVNINADYRIEVSFYITEYVNDGHVVGQANNTGGNSFHLTTYNNRWYAGGGSGEYNFEATSDYPTYGADIVCSITNNDVRMNGVQVLSNYNLISQNFPYCLNARGNAITNGKFKYKYVKIYDENDDLISHWTFGHIIFSSTNLYLARDSIRNIYKVY